MTNLRFQVISITAVFAAVGVGLALGTVARNSPPSAATRDELSALNAQNDDLRAQVDYLGRDEAAREKFTEELAPKVLTTRLQKVNVLVVSTPSGVDNIAGVRRMLEAAGASVTGAIQLTAKFTDPRYENEMRDLAHSALPFTVVGSIAGNLDGVAASTKLLSTVLLKHNPTLSDEDRQTALSSYARGGYLLGTEAVTGSADVVIVVTGPPSAEDDAVQRNGALLTMVSQLDKAGHVVVAGTTERGAGNVVAQVRADAKLRRSVSTVDNVATPQGRLVAVWAAADQNASRTGHYGVGDGADLVPKVSP